MGDIGNLTKGMRISVVLMFIMINSIIMPSLIARPTSATQENEASTKKIRLVNIKFDNSSVVADVGPGSDCIAHLTGTVSCHVPVDFQITRFNISLVPECEWPAEVKPSNLTLNYTDFNRVHQFDVYVQCPEKASLYTSKEVVVKGRMTIYPNNDTQIRYASTTVKIGQYFDFEIKSKATQMVASGSESVTFDLKIVNNGNGHDTFTLEHVEIPQGRSVDITPSSIEIENGTSKIVKVKRKVPATFGPGEEPIRYKILVRSKGAYIEDDILFEKTIEFKIVPRDWLQEAKTPIIFSIAILLFVIALSYYFKNKNNKDRRGEK